RMDTKAHELNGSSKTIPDSCLFVFIRGSQLNFGGLPESGTQENNGRCDSGGSFISVPAFLSSGFHSSSESMPPPAKRENLLLNLAFNIAIPSLILAKASTPERLGPVWGLIVALAFPISYGLWDFAQRRQANFISIIGFASVLLT